MLALFGLSQFQQIQEPVTSIKEVQTFRKRRVASSEKNTNLQQKETNPSEIQVPAGAIVQASLQQTSNEKSSAETTQNAQQTESNNQEGAEPSRSISSTSSSAESSSNTTSSNEDSSSQTTSESEENRSFEQVYVQFAEVPIVSLDSFYNNANPQESLSEQVISVTSTQSLSETLSSLSGLLLLPGESTLTLRNQQPAVINFLVPHPDPVEESIGLRLQIRKLDSTAQTISLEIESLLHLLVENEAPFSSEIRETYQFRPLSEILLVSGLLPQNRNLAQNADLLSSTPLRLLSSEDFLSQIKEFVMLVQVR